MAKHDDPHDGPNKRWPGLGVGLVLLGAASAAVIVSAQRRQAKPPEPQARPVPAPESIAPLPDPPAATAYVQPSRMGTPKLALETVLTGSAASATAPRLELHVPGVIRGTFDRPLAAVRSAAIETFGNPILYLPRRLIAFLVDFLGVTFILAAFYFAFLNFSVSAGNPYGLGSLLILAFGSSFVISLYCEAMIGTTLGKTFAALDLRRTDGGRADLKAVLIRTLFRPVDGLLIGLPLMIASPSRQRLGDRVAGTVVSQGQFGVLGSLLAVGIAGSALFVLLVTSGKTDPIGGVAGAVVQSVSPLVDRIAHIL
ncbi:MAG: RDD family protein [Vulcanimicrobiaceae bacterium]